jgi:hypothetical protein
MLYFVASRKLRHYFQAHKIVVVTSYPLRAILHNSNATGNIAKWAAELAGFQLDFQPRHAIKSQILADFIAEWTPAPGASGGPDQGTDPPRPEVRAPIFTGPHWTLYFDGSARSKGAGAGVVLIDPRGEQLKYMVRLEFEATNNMAEYEALIFGLTAALSLGSGSSWSKGTPNSSSGKSGGSVAAATPSSQPTSSMSRGWRRTSMCWSYNMFHAKATQQLMHSPRAHRPRHPCLRASS